MKREHPSKYDVLQGSMHSDISWHKLREKLHARTMLVSLSMVCGMSYRCQRFSLVFIEASLLVLLLRSSAHLCLSIFSLSAQLHTQ